VHAWYGTDAQIDTVGIPAFSAASAQHREDADRGPSARLFSTGRLQCAVLPFSLLTKTEIGQIVAASADMAPREDHAR
jgi:hypothetical protein